MANFQTHVGEVVRTPCLGLPWNRGSIGRTRRFVGFCHAGNLRRLGGFISLRRGQDVAGADWTRIAGILEGRMWATSVTPHSTMHVPSTKTPPRDIKPQVTNASGIRASGLLREGQLTGGFVLVPLTKDIYKGSDPADLPLYSLTEAAHHLRTAIATIRSWSLGRQYRTQAGVKCFEPVIDIANPANRSLSFYNLVELHVLGSIRRIHEVKLKAVRRAINYLKKHLRSDHPL
jgi:hypothetical protein